MKEYALQKKVRDGEWKVEDYTTSSNVLDVERYYDKAMNRRGDDMRDGITVYAVKDLDTARARLEIYYTVDYRIAEREVGEWEEV